jgi:hypothetical protein
MCESSPLLTLLESLPGFAGRRAVGVRATFGTRWWSFEQLYRSSLYAAHLLAQCKLDAGDRVVLYAPVCPEWIALLLGCALRGLIPVIIDANASAETLRAITDEVAARLVVFTAGQNIEAMACPLLRLDNMEASSELPLDIATLRVSTSSVDTTIQYACSDLIVHLLASSPVKIMDQLGQPAPHTSEQRNRTSTTVVTALSQPNPEWMSHILSSLRIGKPVLFSPSSTPHHLLRVVRTGAASMLVTSSAVIDSLEVFLLTKQESARTKVLFRRAVGPSLSSVVISNGCLRADSREFWKRNEVHVAESTPSSCSSAQEPQQLESISLDEIVGDRDSPRRSARLVRYIESNLPIGQLRTVRDFLRTLPLDSIEQAEVMAMLLDSPLLDAEKALKEEDSISVRSHWKHQAPAWQRSFAGTALRGIVSPVFRRLVFRAFLRERVTGVEHLRGLSGPMIFALRRSDRRHPVEFLAVVKALPSSLGRRVMLGVSDRPFFESHFYRRPGDTWLYRFLVGVVAMFGLPCVFPYVLLESALSHGFEEICCWADRGYYPLVTWSPAMARLATELQATVVPVRLRGRSRGWRNAEVRVHFGAPRRNLPFADAGLTHLEVEAGLRATWPEGVC